MKNALTSKKNKTDVQAAQNQPTAAPQQVVKKNRLKSRLESFGEEIEAVKNRHMALVGETDENYIKRVVSLQKLLSWSSRLLIWSGAVFTEPVSLALGVIGLSAAWIIENMEIGHNVLHGQYDFLEDKKLHSKDYEWDVAVPASQWKHFHNYIHHTYTNVIGRDHDVGYGFIRLSDKVAWNPSHLWQVPMTMLLGLNFQQFTAWHDSRPMEYLQRKAWRPPAVEPRPPWSVFFSKMSEYARKSGRNMLRDYVVMPALAGPAFMWVIGANFTARMLTNLWEFAIIFCGHFTENTTFFTEEEYQKETKAGWYLRQILGSGNLQGSPLFYFMTGHLSHQVEHHLFPDVPAHRYPEMGREVEAICKKYGVPYNTAGFLKQFATVAARIVRFSFKNARETKSAEYNFDVRSLDRPDWSQAGFAPATITYVRQETADTKTYTIYADHYENWRPGSFISIRLTIDGKPVVRTYTLSSSPTSGVYEITVKRVKDGLVSNYLFEHGKTGLQLEVSHPAGEFHLPEGGSDVVMIAGGSGITPMMSILRSGTAGRQVAFLNFVRSKNDVIFRSELEEMDADGTIELSVFCEDTAGRADKEKLAAAGDLTDKTVLLCGPAPMMKAVRTLLKEMGHRGQLIEESFGQVPLNKNQNSQKENMPVAESGHEAARHTVNIKSADRETLTVSASDDRSLLETAEENGLKPDYGCRQGICHTCKCLKTSGRVKNLQTGEVSSDGPAQIRLCVSAPVTETTLELDS